MHQLLRLFPAYGFPGIFHRKTQKISFCSSLNHQFSRFGGALQPIKNRIFHQGLQRQLGKPGPLQAGIEADGVLHNILVAGLLDLEVAADMPLLLPQGDDILAAAQGMTEEIREIGDHLHRRLMPVRLDEPDNGVHGVVEKVRVDLSLEQRQLRSAEAGLLLSDLLNLGVDPGDHLLHALTEGADLIGLRPDRLPDRQVPADHVLRPAAEIHHRLRDRPGQTDAVAGQQKDQGGRQRQHQADLRRDLPGDLLLE